ncbi:MAG: lipid A deacylase LpxR family protein [Proteobacteria bacterium]|nr:lipid A deacylase LpxR family protein [Pseudomonadota bacterium]
MPPRLLPFLLALATAILLSAPVHAEDAPRPGEHWAMSLYNENDKLAGTDQHYTNAVKLTVVTMDLREYAHSEVVAEYFPWLIPAIKEAPFVNDPEKTRNIAFSIGNEIYTPIDVKATQLIRDDRPYAGWTYASLALHAKDANRLDTFETTLGIVGPSAHSDSIQNNFHRLIGTFPSDGWNNQLRDEPGIMLSWQRRLRHEYLFEDSPWGVDFVPHLGATAGNVLTYANLGGQVRLGYHLPRDFGVSPIQTGSTVGTPTEQDDPRLNGDWGFNIFAGADGRAVARNIFLDGNTFRQSHHVDKIPFVADLYGGASLFWDRWTLTYTRVYRSREFTEQKDGQVFGSFNLSVTF